MTIQSLNLEFGYGEENIIHDCSFTCEKGKIYCLLGPNGSGKTTILKLLNGILKPGRGRVLVDGYNIGRLRKKEIARLMAVLPQEHNGVFPYTVLEMVVMGRNPYLNLLARPQRKDYRIAEKALDMLGIIHIKEKCYMEISGGEKQLVFLARAIAQESSFFLMDEPTSHLDFYNQYQIMVILRQLVQNNGCGVIIAMHDPNLTITFADEVLMVKKGRLLKEGSVEKVMTAENLSSLYGLSLKIADIGDNRKCVFV